MLNYSNISTESQNELLDNIEKKSKREREYILHVLIFQYVSFQPGMNKFMFVVGEHEGSLISQYIDQIIFNNETDLITFDNPNDLGFMESDYVFNYLTEKRSNNSVLDLLLLPSKIVQNISQMNSFNINELLSSGGVIIIYGDKDTSYLDALTRIGCYETDGVSFSVYQKQRTLDVVVAKKLFALTSLVKSTTLDNKEVISSLIKTTSELEHFIQCNRDVYKLHHIRYHINELKNALLNIYISDRYDSVLEADLMNVIDHIESI